MQKFIRKHSVVVYSLFSALVSAGLMLLLFGALKMAPFGEESILISDMSQQYIDYFAGLRDAVTEGKSFLYTWNTGMGMNFLGLFAYYLSSPFTFIILLFPKAMIVEAVTFLSVIKTGACALTFCLLLCRLRGKSTATDILFSVLYALMGYTVVYYFNIMWMDAVIFLPLILMGLEDLIERKRILLFTLSLFFLFVANFYISFMAGIFIFLWLIFRLVCNRWQNGKRIAVHFSAGVLLAAGMAAILLVPAYFSLKSAYGDMTSMKWEGNLQTTPQVLFQRMMFCSSDIVTYDGSANIYCGILTVILLPIYFCNKKFSGRERISAGVLLFIFVISMMFWDISTLWHAFRAPNFFNYRFSFAYCCFVLLLAWRAFERLDGVRLRTVLFSGAAVCAAMLAASFFSEKVTVSSKAVMVSIILVVLYSMFLAGYKCGFRPVLRTCLTAVLFLCILLETYVNGQYSLNFLGRTMGGFDKIAVYNDAAALNTKMKEAAQENEQDSQAFYRMENWKMRWSNDNIANGYNGIAHYSSLSNRSAFKFMKNLGMLCCTNDRYLRYFGSTNVIDDLFGVKYVAAMKERRTGYTQIADLDGAVLSLNENALPLGYTADKGVLDYSPNFQDPFVNQNLFLSALLGTETNVFSIINDFELELFHIRQEGNAFSVTGSNAQFIFRLKNPVSQQVYMRFSSNFNEQSPIEVNGELIGRSVDDYLRASVPLGYFEAGEEIEVRIHINYENSGKVYFFSFAGLDEGLLNSSIQKLAQSSGGFTAEGARVSGIVTAQEDQVLFTTIPYDAGWKAEVDGVPAEICSVDNAFIAIPVAEGEHRITLHYTPKGFIAGIWVSAGSILMFIAALLLIDYPKYFVRLRKKWKKAGAS